MKSLMQCKHGKVKLKLVAWAYKYRNSHEQGFSFKKCCAKCGKQLGS